MLFDLRISKFSMACLTAFTVHSLFLQIKNPGKQLDYFGGGGSVVLDHSLANGGRSGLAVPTEMKENSSPFASFLTKAEENRNLSEQVYAYTI